MMDFGKSRAKMTTQEQIHTTFKNVAGLQEEKEDLKEIVDFLKMPQKYIKVGARTIYYTIFRNKRAGKSF